MTEKILFKMTLKILILAFVTLLVTQTAQADAALGLVLGSPTGISGRARLDAGHSFEAVLAYTYTHYDGLEIHGTYLWDRARFFATQHGPINMYYGLGGRVVNIHHGRHDGELAIGPRAPLGLIYDFHKPDIEVYGELAASLDVIPSTDVDIAANIGFRIRF